MKKILTLSLLCLSFSSFASTAKLIASCRQVGINKITMQANDRGIHSPRGPIDMEVKECGVDNRPLSPSKYVWFCAKIEGYEEIKVLTQKPLLGRCF